MDKLLSKEENTDEILYFPKEKTKNITINSSSFILYDIERKYLTLSEFIHNNSNGPSYFQTSFESIYPKIIITEKIDPIFVQNAMDLGFVDRIFLSSYCMEILNDTLITQLSQLTRTQNYYVRFFSISPEYNEDTGEYLKAYHLITMNNSEETRIQIMIRNQRNLGITIDNGQRPEEHWA